VLLLSQARELGFETSPLLDLLIEAELQATSFLFPLLELPLGNFGLADARLRELIA
jgi:hypothetical protein